MDKTEETRTVRDPFLGVDAVISNRLTDRLRGKYACGPTLPNGEPEFGWRENWAPPIQHEAAARIETLEAEVSTLTRERDQAREALRAAREFVVKALAELVELDDFDPSEHHLIKQIDTALSAAPAPEAADGERS